MNTVDAVKHVLLRSGASWVLWLLGASLITTVAISVERWLFYRTREGDLPALARRLGAHLAGRDFDAAAQELGRSRSVAAAIAAAGLELAAAGPAAADKAMQSAAALERRGLERWLAYLGTLGNNAPFVGLFGTVIGIIGAFEELGRGHGTAGGAGAAGAAQVASQVVMASVAEALVATAAGILVALPAVMAFNYFQRRVASLLSGTEVLSNLVLAYLSRAPGPRV
ncbi:MAG: MotA/TolQ/ExbB proton channel family protein [Myxococcales bacterium]